jgi:hypothetical protein
MPISDEEIVLSALQTLVQFGLTASQVIALLDMPERTAADVRAQLDATDATIAQLKEDD